MKRQKNIFVRFKEQAKRPLTRRLATGSISFETQNDLLFRDLGFLAKQRQKYFRPFQDKIARSSSLLKRCNLTIVVLERIDALLFFI